MIQNRKVVIIGDGAVGSTTAFTLLLHDSATDIVIVDINKNKAEGDILDMQHGISFVEPKKLKAGNYEDCQDAHIVIITAGVAQKVGETRIDLLKRNLNVFYNIIESIKPYINEETILLVVTNPVDILSYYTYLKSGLPANHVIGSGTVLDTARLKAIISEDTNIDPRNIHAFVVGEHGDSEVSAFSITSVGGIPINEYCDRCHKCDDCGLTKLSNIQDKVKNSAYEIIAKKGATYYAVAMAVNRIVETILNNQNSVLTISTYVENEFEGQIQNVYLSLPTIVGSNGAIKILHPKYNENERQKIIESALSLKEKYKIFN